MLYCTTNREFKKVLFVYICQRFIELVCGAAGLTFDCKLSAKRFAKNTKSESNPSRAIYHTNIPYESYYENVGNTFGSSAGSLQPIWQVCSLTLV